MEALSVKKIIEFTGKSDKSRRTFVQNLKQIEERKNAGDGPNYWVTSLSAICNSFKNNNLQFIKKKAYELEEKYEKTEFERTKIMYGRNIDILYKYEVFDFNIWKPDKRMTFLKKHKSESIISINGILVKAAPHYVFSFGSKENKEIGAIWFIVKLDGYKKKELGIFSDVLYRYLNKNYSDDYNVNPRYCIAVDVLKKKGLSYSQLQKKEIPFLLDKIIEEIRKII